MKYIFFFLFLFVSCSKNNDVISKFISNVDKNKQKIEISLKENEVFIFARPYSSIEKDLKLKKNVDKKTLNEIKSITQSSNYFLLFFLDKNHNLNYERYDNLVFNKNYVLHGSGNYTVFIKGCRINKIEKK